MRWRGLAAAVAAVALGAASELVGYGWDRPQRWVPDLVVGLVVVGAGLAAWSRQRGAGTLLAVTGAAWFAGNLDPLAVFWHRGPLVHLLVTFPGWRPRPRLAVAAVAAAYVASAVPALAGDLAWVVLSAALVAVVAMGYAGSAGPWRRYRRAALWAASALAAVLAAGAVVRLLAPTGEAVQPALLAYEAVLGAMAIGLAVVVRRAPTAAVTDLVVELGASRSGPLRDRLARVLGDPSLQVGYWSEQAAGYLDAMGDPVPVPEPGGQRSATLVGQDGDRIAVLVHDRAVLDDPVLAEAVAAATRLTAAHAALRAEVLAQVSELTASRRRLVVAADEQRRDLERRLYEGPRRRLVRLRDTLAAAASSRHDERPHLARAVAQLAGTCADLDELARGLHPHELAGGLAVALARLAERGPVPVRLTVSSERFPSEVEVAAWYTCAEALANAAKHAAASAVSVDIRRAGHRVLVEVVDNGRGGADPAGGTGLRGLADRLEALGGRLVVESPPEAGTRLVAELPLGDQPE